MGESFPFGKKSGGGGGDIGEVKKEKRKRERLGSVREEAGRCSRRH